LRSAAESSSACSGPDRGSIGRGALPCRDHCPRGRLAGVPRPSTEIIDVGRREIASNAGAASPAEYRRRLADDPANTPASKEELLTRAREDIERAREVAPRFFGTLPKAGC
jgi:hypothetical protein